jgi:hypothetical protein
VNRQKIKWVLIVHAFVLVFFTLMGGLMGMSSSAASIGAALSNMVVSGVLIVLDVIIVLAGLLARLTKKPTEPFGQSWVCAFLLSLGGVLIVNTPLCFMIAGLNS